MAALTRAEHDRVLTCYSKPKWLVATKSDSSSKRFFSGDETDLRHDYWVIRTEDPEKVYNADHTLNFTHVVNVGNVKLNDPLHVSDLLTAKVMVIEALRGQYIPAISAKVVAARVPHFAWIIRWRQVMGIDRMGSLMPSHFQHFCASLEHGTLGLIPFTARVDALEARVLDGDYNFPLYNNHGRPYVSLSAVAAELGINNLQKEARVRIVERFKIIRPEIEFFDVSASTKDKAQTDTPSTGYAKLILQVWHNLFELSHFGLIPHDPLSFNPFSDINIDQRAQQISQGRSDSRTRTPGPDQWIALFDAAAKWLLEYSGPILEVCAKIPRRNKVTSAFARRAKVQAIIDATIPPDFPRLVPIFARAQRGGNGITLNDAVSFIIIASIILIGGMSARRRGEILSLRVNCTRYDPFGNLWLTSYIEKTIQDIDQIPVPTSVGIAVRLLEDLSRTARDRNGHAWILDIDRPSITDSRDRTGFDLKTQTTQLLNKFAAISGIPPAADGTVFQFAIHQLRRGFAIYYYHGYKYSNLDALSRFLRHFDPTMTLRYVTEVMPGALMRLREERSAQAKVAEELRRRKSENEAKAIESEMEETSEAIKSLEDRIKTFNAVREEALVGHMLDMHDGTDSPIGFGAATLYQELEEQVAEARRQVRVTGRSNVPPDEEREALVPILRRFAKAKRLEPHPGRHIHCGWIEGKTEEIARARCIQKKAAETGETGDRQPDFTYSSTEDCLECPLGVAFKGNTAVLNAKKRDYAIGAEKAPSSDARRAAADMYASIKAKMAAAQAAVVGGGVR